MAALSCPDKYKTLGQFALYYQGMEQAPILTVFIGGNHEASNYLRDLYYGGFAAPNIYFLGSSGFVNVTKGNHTVTVGGISGIEKEFDFQKGYFEEYPYVHNWKNIKSMYHIRAFEVLKTKLFQPDTATAGPDGLIKTQPVDIFVSHEWPTVVTSRVS